MNKSETNVFFRMLDIFAHFVLLNLIWIICCLPVVTIFPATAALFAVVRKWITEGTDAGTVRLFFGKFRENFRKSFLIGLGWMVAGVILYVDYSILLQYDIAMKSAIFGILVFASLVYVFMSLYIFFVLVHFELSIVHTLKNALLLSVSHYFHTLLCLAVVGIAIAVSVYFPLLLIVMGSVSAFILYSIFHQLTARMEKRKEQAQL